MPDEVIQLDDDVEDALWFSGRDWHELTRQDWEEHSDAIFFFDPEAFAYYLPSILLLSAQNPNESLNAADSLISELDCTTVGNPAELRSRNGILETTLTFRSVVDASGVSRYCFVSDTADSARASRRYARYPS